MHKNNKLANKKGSEITFKDLSEQNMIMINKNTILSFFVKTYEQYQLNGNLEVINGDWETIRNFIKLDLGIHMYSSLYAKYKEFQDNDLVLKKVEHLFPNINLYFVSKYNNSLRKPLKKFIEIATEETSKDFSF